jgi:hypothetical protein
MASKPELLIYQSLRGMFSKHFPKGRWILQRIETSTGVGIPDIYFSLLVNEQHMNMWIETKTVDYVVSNEQLNWAYQHTLTGGLTYIVTRINTAQIPAKSGINNPATTAYSTPNLTSNILAHPTLYPQLHELCNGPYTQCENITNERKKGQETLVFLSFDDRMRECSSLGVYIRRFNPPMLEVGHWARHMADCPSQSL